MHTTARRILDTLAQYGPLSAGEIARHLRLTPQNVRHHLSRLRADGWVLPADPAPATGRGRRAMRYTLHPARREHNLAGLCHALLDLWLEGQSEAAADARLEALAQRLAHLSTPPGGNLTQRLYHAVRRLNALGYQARWEAHADAPRVVLDHCPYLSLAEEQPALCRMDAHLLQQLCAAPVTQTARRGTDGRVCVFRIG